MTMVSIATHSAMVLPLVRLDLTTSVIFAGEIDVEVDDPTLETVIEQDEVIGVVEECDEIEVVVEQEELTVAIEENDC